MPTVRLRGSQKSMLELTVLFCGTGEGEREGHDAVEETRSLGVLIEALLSESFAG